VVAEHVGQALSLARQRRDADGFVGVGGDGTLFDLLNGMDPLRQALAVVPAGTGNGVARTLGLRDAEDGLQRIRSGTSRRVDLIAVEARFPSGEGRSWRILSTAALGYAADVVVTANVSLKPFGSLCYPLASLARAVLARRFGGRWRLGDGAWRPLDATNVVVNNTRHAGNFEVFPEASVDDGLADVLVARPGFLRQVVHNVSVLSGRHFYRSGEVAATPRAEFELDEDQTLMLDGEIVTGVVWARFTVAPRALAVFA
jgi:diacylglycerol kinase (ATP)